jgi:hypothetical protein
LKFRNLKSKDNSFTSDLRIMQLCINHKSVIYIIVVEGEILDWTIKIKETCRIC